MQTTSPSSNPAPAAASEAAAPTRVFISYSRRDEAAVVRITAELVADPAAEAAVDVLRDKEDILPAEAWSDRLVQLITQADAFALFLTPDAVASVEVGREIEQAVKLGKRIVPVLVRDTPPAQVPEAAAQLNYVFLREGDDFGAGIAALRGAVLTDIAWVREHTRVGELAGRWQAAGRRGAELLRGPALEAAESWLARQPATAPPATALQREFVAAGRRAATQRLRNWVLGSASVAVLAIALSLVALWQRHEATVRRTDAQARRLVAEAQAALAEPLNRGDAPVQALLASIALRDSDAAREALVRGVRRLEPVPLARLPWPKGMAATGVMRLDFSADGKHLLMLTRSGLAAWLLPQGQLAWSQALDTVADDARIVFAADGLHAVLLPGGQVIDLTRGTLAPPPRAEVRDVAVIDGRLIALVDAAAERAAIVADAVSGEALWRVPLEAPLKAARLVPRTTPQALAPNPLMMMAMEPRLDGAAVLLDARANVRVAVADPAQAGAAKLMVTRTLPAGATLLGLGERGRMLALQHGDGRVAVYDVLAGREAWQGTPGDTAPVSFTGDDRWLWVNGRTGLRLQALNGGSGVAVEDARRSDWDLQALDNVNRYSAIIAATASDDGAVLATAWKDGRVDVWRPGTKPRYGAIDATPRTNFERVAGFDHGEVLGATVTWQAPPPLFLSPSGRFAASQSMGLQTNAVGGVTALQPKVRVWDTRLGIEVARFARTGAMLLRFAPNDDALVTLAAGDEPVLELWTLAEPQAEVARRTVPVALPASAASAVSVPAGADAQMQANIARATLPTVESTPRAWLGVDGRLRLADTASGRVLDLADLNGAMQLASAASAQRLREIASRPAPDVDATTREWLERLAQQASAADKPGSVLAPMPSTLTQAAMVPRPGVPIAVAGDGRHAVLKLGPQLVSVALDGTAAVREMEIEGDLGIDPITLAAASIAVSANGRYAALERIDRAALLDTIHRLTQPSPDADAASQPAGPPKPQPLARDIVVVDLQTRRITGTWLDERQLWPVNTPLGPLLTASRPLAVSDDGRKLALERRQVVMAPGTPPSSQAQLAVVDLASRSRTDLGPWQAMPSPLDFGAIAAATPIAAAFSPTAKHLVTEATAPDCPLKVVVHPMSMLPTTVPSCADVRTRLTRWDLGTARMLGEMTFRRRAPAQAEAQVPMPFMASPRAPATLAMVDDHTVRRVVTAWQLAPLQAPGPWTLEVVDERIDLGQTQVEVSWACRRLAPSMRELAADAWRRELPGETPAPLCPARLDR